MKPYILSNLTREEIDATSLFGKDAAAFLDACHELYEYCMGRKNDGHYFPRPPAGVMGHAYFEWLNEHPEEKAKYEDSKNSWKSERARQYRILYGIAKRHGYYLKKCKYHTEQWAIYRRCELIGFIHCA